MGLSYVTLPTKHSLISMQIGKLPVLNVKQLEDGLRGLPSLNVELGRENDMAHHLLISMRKDNEQISSILAQAGWTRIELPGELRAAKKDVFKELSEKLKTLADEQKTLELKADDLVRKDERHLKDVW